MLLCLSKANAALLLLAASALAGYAHAIVACKQGEYADKICLVGEARVPHCCSVTLWLAVPCLVSF